MPLKLVIIHTIATANCLVWWMHAHDDNNSQLAIMQLSTQFVRTTHVVNME